MSNLLKDALNALTVIAVLSAMVGLVAIPLEFMRRADRTRQKRLAIYQYAKRLGRLLRTRYGIQQKYSPMQVKKMMKKWGYSTDYDRYGLAMYCDRADFIDYHRAIGESCDYETLRSEISHYLFGRDRELSISDVIKANIYSQKRRGSIYRGDLNLDYLRPDYRNPDTSRDDCGGYDGGEGGEYCGYD